MDQHIIPTQLGHRERGSEPVIRGVEVGSRTRRTLGSRIEDEYSDNKGVTEIETGIEDGRRCAAKQALVQGLQGVKKVGEKKLRRASEIALVLTFRISFVCVVCRVWRLCITFLGIFLSVCSCGALPEPRHQWPSHRYLLPYRIRAPTLHSGDSMEASYIRLMKSTTTTTR
jgi:hypothetical protein